MIEMAQKREEIEKFGIQYEVHGLMKPYTKQKFDIAFSTFVLHYARSYEMLKSFVTNIFNMLKEKGYVLGNVQNPFLKVEDFTKLSKFKTKMEVEKIPIQPYDPLHVYLLGSEEDSSFVILETFLVPSEDYEKVFKECVSEERIRKSIGK